MKKIVVFAGSNSKHSINKELAAYAASFLMDKEIKVLDLNKYPLPIYGIDEENENGIPEMASSFYKEIQSADGLILSLAEHNGNFTVAFKNMFDWMSRIAQKLWQNTPMLLMATSPGARGGASALNIAKSGFPYMGGNIVSDFSLPKFHDNFKGNVIVEANLLESLKKAVRQFEKAV